MSPNLSHFLSSRLNEGVLHSVMCVHARTEWFKEVSMCLGLRGCSHTKTTPLMNDWLSESRTRVDIHNLDSIAESTAAPPHCEGPTVQLAYDLTACAVS